MPDLLTPRVATAPPAPPRAAPDPAVAALPRLARLRDALRAAGRFRAAVRAGADRRWRVPPLFFFHPGLQAEWDAARPSTRPDPAEMRAARRDPDGAAAWEWLPELLADAVPLLLESADVRRAARAVPGLVAAARAVGVANDLADLLAVADDEVVIALDPEAGAGWRVRVQGVADVAQFHVLFADAAADHRPDARAVAAYRGWPAPPGGPAPEATARFQLFRPTALRPDGSLPAGFAGSDHWLWWHEPFAAVPLLHGERVILLADPAYPVTWDADPRFPGLSAEVDVLEELGQAEVAERIAELTGRPAVRRARVAAAAAA